MMLKFAQKTFEILKLTSGYVSIFVGSHQIHVVTDNLLQASLVTQPVSSLPITTTRGGLFMDLFKPGGSSLGLRFASNKSNKAVGLKVYNPTTPGFRGRITTSRKDLWKGGPFKPLTAGMARTGGRNFQGRITSRHRGGGHRKVYRLIDFARAIGKPPGVVERIEYDPNRSARIVLVKHTMPAATTSTPPSQAYSYFLAPQGIAVGDKVESGTDAAIKPGNTLPLENIPIGMNVHNIELRPGCGGQLVRAAGASATLIKKGDDGYSVLRLPSGEQRFVLSRCMATIGALSNPLHKNRKLGKAGATRWLGRRPRVRGVAMNPVDHPHGGGRGKSKGRISQTPWGKPTKGFRTRNNKQTDRFIRVTRHKAKARA